jgi:hypothetical protein
VWKRLLGAQHHRAKRCSRKLRCEAFGRRGSTSPNKGLKRTRHCQDGASPLNPVLGRRGLEGGTLKSVAALGFLLTVPVAIARAQSSTGSPTERRVLEEEKAAILDVIERQAAAFWAKDFQRWADTWVHTPYIRRLGWSEVGGVSSVEGWEAIGARMKKSMADNPKPNLTPAKLARERLNFRIYGDVAWVTFEQHGVSTGEPRFDMPGLSYETRILEKHNGRWKVAYLGYLLAASSEARPAR